jgi:hypothetical protein
MGPSSGRKFYNGGDPVSLLKMCEEWNPFIRKRWRNVIDQYILAHHEIMVSTQYVIKGNCIINTIVYLQAV